MKAISLWQPWASALFAVADPARGPHAIKLHETRSWPMPKWLIGQRVAIQAAVRLTGDEREFWEDVVRPRYLPAFARLGICSISDMPRGCLIGEVEFGPSRQTTGHFAEPDESSRDFGNYSEGRWAWPVVSHHRYERPIPCKGMQGFFNVASPQPAQPSALQSSSEPKPEGSAASSASS